jgi:hypothetical protein
MYVNIYITYILYIICIYNIIMYYIYKSQVCVCVRLCVCVCV